jgi:hypothetical protein
VSWQRIRLLRSRPPERVALDPERQAVFNAALEQSEQLMRAAETVSAAAQPLPLFYSLSQAGRAIAAARLEERWLLHGHGLTSGDDSKCDLLRRTVTAQPAQRAGDRQDSFQGVAAAIKSGVFAGAVQIGAVWGAVPDLLWPEAQMPLDNPDWRRPIRAYSPWSDDDIVVYRGLSENYAQQAILGGLAEGSANEMEAELNAHYPVATDARIMRLQAGAKDTPVARDWVGHEHLPRFVWPKGTNLPIAAYRPGERPSLFLPAVADGANLSPLMLWWVLLFGLSMVARYDPEVWVAALDVNASEQAVPIEAALAEAITALPALVLTALTE